MKGIVLLLAGLVGMSSLGFAHEDIACKSKNVLLVKENVCDIVNEDEGFYVGIAYSHLSHDIDYEYKTTNVELDFPGLMLDVGYRFNEYIAVELKYSFSIGDTDLDDYAEEADMSTLGLFLKPTYPIAPEMDIYVLVGYSLTDANNDYESTSFSKGSFSWGAGTGYDLGEDFTIFAEYIHYYDNTINEFDHVNDGFNLGVLYKI